MAGRPLRVAILGSKFMGRAHASAWRRAGEFFDLPVQPEVRWMAGRDPVALADVADRWGIPHRTTDWREPVGDPEVDLVDVATPNHVHRVQALAALEAGKHVACEKPLAGTLDDARDMALAARTAEPGTFVWYNYRRVPAVGLAHRLVAEGRLGRIYHVRAAYLQDWGGPDSPLTWRFRSEEAGSGAHGDLNAHMIDMARFVTGEEIDEVAGAIEHRFVESRPLPDEPGRTGPSTVDDTVVFLARLTGGAVASFEATRLATGMRNANRIEVHGELGAIRFDFTLMNQLEYFDARSARREQGWRTIVATDPLHPYAANWWPVGHGLGYDHTFANQAADIARVVGGGEAELPIPDFEDALVTQRVMQAALESARRHAPVELREIT